MGERTATIWVETDRPCEVRVVAGRHGVDASARTFTVHGHHYALVDVDGLEPGSEVPYEVLLDGEPVWPEERSPFPPSTIRTPAPGPGDTLKIAFGSCRRAPDRSDRHGLDALLMIGDQVYADELSDEMRAYIAQRRGPGGEPRDELADFEEYTYLYRLAWREDAAVRWLLST
ncbi:MAG: alkaline phosphatase family protein, partial [Actinomadura rubrobrunea]|nr:alkaline phosphatase family protein [Actinomadura rubrobrunea]